MMSRVLVVDDNDVDRERLRRLLHDHHKIVEAATAEQGVSIAGSEDLDCVLLDYRLPDRDGTDVIRLFRELSADLDLNLFYSERGHFTLAHADSTLRTMRWRAEVNKHLGVDSRVIDPDEVRRICPTLNIECGGLPIVGALYHPPGAIVRHDSH